jgi:hypothetical protein
MTKKSKKIMIVILVLVAGTAIAVPLAISHYNKRDFSKMTPQQFRQYMDSNEFRDANEDKRREVFQEMRDAMEARVEKQANEYAALTPDAKTVYLDKIIDEMQARRAEFMARDANRPDANGPPDPNRFRRFGPRDPNSPRRQMAGQQRQFRQPNPSRMRERSERISADSRVKMMQFRQDMMNRMQERGIQMGPGGGRGGFGGGFGGPGGPPPGAPGGR